MERRPDSAAHRADLRERLDRPDLIVGGHDGDEGRIGPEGGSHIFHPDHAVLIYVQKLDLKALLFQPLKGMKYGMVFKFAGNDMPFPPLCPRQCRGTDGLIVRLAPAGGKVDFIWFGVQARRHGFTGSSHGLRRPVPNTVGAGRIAVDLVEVGQHGLFRGGAHGRSGRVVSVNQDWDPPFP